MTPCHPEEVKRPKDLKDKTGRDPSASPQDDKPGASMNKK